MSSFSLYEYVPLRADKNEMRLLRLLPGNFNDEICIEMIHVESDSKPKYEALSYVWGPSERVRQLVISKTTFHEKLQSRIIPELVTEWLSKRSGKPSDAHVLGIGYNLFIALKYLRKRSGARVLWIDAICINQDDLEERSSEVSKMAVIYCAARQVIVWLGEESDDSAQALSNLQSIGGKLSIEKTRHSSYLHPVEAVEELHRKLLASPQSDFKWVAINNLLERAWCTRLWVCQEIHLASSAVIWVGARRIDWEVFKTAIAWILVPIVSSDLREYINPTTLLRLEATVLLSEGMSLMVVTDLLKHTFCFDPRDRICALLSLLDSETAVNITPQYSLSMEEVYLQAALADIPSANTLQILQWAQFKDNPRTRTVPSWVPNFSRPEKLRAVYEYGVLRNVLVEFEYNNHDKSLRVQGRFVDSITSVSTSVPQNASVRETFDICLQWEPIDARSTLNIAGGSLFEAFVQVLSIKYCDSTLAEKRLWPDVASLVGAYEAVERNDEDIETSKFAANLHAHLKDCVLFRTSRGHIGSCSSAALVGDQIINILGCSTPLLVRRMEPSGDRVDHFEVGGACYAAGLMNGEGLLGPLPSGWTYTMELIKGYPCTVFTDRNDCKTQLDPRSGPPPSGWITRYSQLPGEDLNEQQEEKWDDGHMWWEDTDTMTEADPRLTSEHLKTLGIELQDIVLV